MSLLSVPFTFSPGAVIVAAQHNTNFSTIYSDYSGNITNANMASNAGVVYSKLSLTGGIVNADINSSAAIANSKLNLTTITQNITFNGNTLIGSTNQGDILYDNGTTLTRLIPGTSGQFLKTQGSTANPIWSNVGAYSNVLFEYGGSTIATAGHGEVIDVSISPGSKTPAYRFLRVSPGDTQIVYSTKFMKIGGLSTITVYCTLWTESSGQANLLISIGGQTGNINGTSSQTTPEWKFFTIDVSSLTNGSVYDVNATLSDVSGASKAAACGNIIGFGS